MYVTSVCMSQVISVGKHSSLGGPQRLNRIDLYGKNLIPMEKLYNLGGHGPLDPPVPTPMSQVYAGHKCMHVTSVCMSQVYACHKCMHVTSVLRERAKEHLIWLPTRAQSNGLSQVSHFLTHSSI